MLAQTKTRIYINIIMPREGLIHLAFVWYDHSVPIQTTTTKWKGH